MEREEFQKQFLAQWWPLIDLLNLSFNKNDRVTKGDVLKMSDEQKITFIRLVRSAKHKGITFFEAANRVSMSHWDIFKIGKESSRRIVDNLSDGYIRRRIKLKNCPTELIDLKRTQIQGLRETNKLI